MKTPQSPCHYAVITRRKRRNRNANTPQSRRRYAAIATPRNRRGNDGGPQRGRPVAVDNAHPQPRGDSYI
ncbi:hypothetical protein HMPREF9136_1283 [Prevotella dentalis DSM 3688]|uniref:Uncharacterized protein n=1 Tax=Prevotella dentalis (strain ATCC 49559 / DSM 3688 / JCM 13448 / NCTC 12043 / ES 2772) TaxID=908937 RepID=F9D355_PREDD|nr:hypothetical protein HMPREF9136_1283 [Prevotella dentalis DSM 3688]